MIPEKRKRKVLAIGVLIAFLCIVGGLFNYVAFPPNYLSNKAHFSANIESFVQLARVFDENLSISELKIGQAALIEIRVDDGGTSVDFSENELAEIAVFFTKTAVDVITRRDRHIEFYAGDESKLGRNFQARVIYQEDVQSAVNGGTIADCSEVFILDKPNGECLDTQASDWAIHYLWVTI